MNQRLPAEIICLPTIHGLMGRGLAADLFHKAPAVDPANDPSLATVVARIWRIPVPADPLILLDLLASGSERMLTRGN